MNTARLLSGCIGVALLTLVSACGGGRDSVGSALFFASGSINPVIGSLIDAVPATGTVTFDRSISGTNTGFNPTLGGLAIDGTSHRLYVTQGASIRVFDNAIFANGNLAPSRVIYEVESGGYRSPLLDVTNNRLYVANIQDASLHTSSIYVFNNASTASYTSPTRTITSNFGGNNPNMYSIALDSTRDKIYALVQGGFTIAGIPSAYVRVAVLNHASTVNGTVMPDSYIDICDMEIGTVIMDAASDRLYLSQSNSVHVFDNASTLSGSVSPTRSIDFGDTAEIRHMAVDLVNDRLYALSFSKLYIVDSASIAEGTANAMHISFSGVEDLTAIAVKQ